MRTNTFFHLARFFLLLVTAVISSLLLCSCLAAERSSGGVAGPRVLESDGQVIGEATRLSIFLNLNKPTGPDVRMNLEAVEIMANGVWIPMTSEALMLDAGEIGAGQVFISRRVMASGVYESLRFRLADPVISMGGKEHPLELVDPVFYLTLPAGLEMASGDSRSVFITWDVEQSISASGKDFSPVLSTVPQAPPLAADLVYVACPDIDTVYVIRSDKNWVYGSLGISGRPSFLGVNSSSKRLFVLSPAEAIIKVVDIQTNRLADTIKIPMVQNPDFMIVSPDGQWAYILDTRDSYIIRMDLSNGSLDKRVRLGFRPQYAEYLAGYDRVAVSSSLANTVYILDDESLDTIDTVSVGTSPVGLAAWGSLLYIAESGAGNVTVYDLYSRQIKNRLRVGIKPMRIFQHNDRIYVANNNSGTVSILMSGQFNVAREIRVGGKPLEMAASSTHKWLYIGNEGNGGLSVVDATTNRVAAEINLNTAPLGIAVVQ